MGDIREELEKPTPDLKTLRELLDEAESNMNELEAEIFPNPLDVERGKEQARAVGGPGLRHGFSPGARDAFDAQGPGL